ncbi:MAG: hypothetical protein M1838_003207 [Thelocarpon superellum]|nr:MAG: hypothetical protein M1838_003207 [Thelocarpon superellum]
MALPALPELLQSLTTSLTSASTSLPADSSGDISTVTGAEGISLLETKNELLLSYLHHLIFLILVKLRHHRNSPTATSSTAPEPRAEDAGPDQPAVVTTPEEETLEHEIRRMLVELRIYLERGVRPLEGKLKYQIDKVVRAAEEEDQLAVREANGTKQDDQDEESHDEDDDDDDDDDDDEDDEDASRTEPAMTSIDELSYRPNPSAFARATRPSSSTRISTNRVGRTSSPPPAPTAAQSSSTSQAYKPPRITPTSLSLSASHSTSHPSSLATSSHTNKAHRASATLTEFLTTELSSTPVAEPSIGSTMLSSSGRRGSKGNTQRARQEAQERREYEEANFVRLPKEGKSKAKGKKNRSGAWDGEEGGGTRQVYGGEEFTGLGRGAERVASLLSGPSSSSRGGEKSGGKRSASGGGVLERSRKRMRNDS